MMSVNKGFPSLDELVRRRAAASSEQNVDSTWLSRYGAGVQLQGPASVKRVSARVVPPSAQDIVLSMALAVIYAFGLQTECFYH